MVELRFEWIFDVVHFRRDLHYLYFFQQDVVVLDFLAIVVDAIKFEFGAFESLACGRSLIEVCAGGIDFFGEYVRSMGPRTGQFSGVVVGGDVDAVVVSDHLDTAFATLHGH
ncbi:hypothetical protein D3C81_1959060 [compost metagenome]